MIVMCMLACVALSLFAMEEGAKISKPMPAIFYVKSLEGVNFDSEAEAYKQSTLSSKSPDHVIAQMQHIVPYDFERPTVWHTPPLVIGFFHSLFQKRLPPPALPEPYGMRLPVKQGDTLYCIGDIHGDYRTLECIANKLFDENGTLCDKNGYLIFQGDCNDSGFFAADVWYLLGNLSHKNPGRIFMIQGNHEAPEAGMGSGFVKQLKSFVNDEKVQLYTKQELQAARAFQYKLPRFILPYTLSSDGKSAEYLAITHAWIEPGITDGLKAFLANQNQTQKYFKYRLFNRAHALAQMGHEVVDAVKSNGLEALLCAQGDFTELAHHSTAARHSDQSQWPFLIHDDDTCIVKKAGNFTNTFSFGKIFAEKQLNLLHSEPEKDLTFWKKLLRFFSLSRSLSYAVSSVVRSHQHEMATAEGTLTSFMHQLLSYGVHQKECSLISGLGTIITTPCSGGSFYGLPSKQGQKIPCNYSTIYKITVAEGPARTWERTIVTLPLYPAKAIGAQASDFHYYQAPTDPENS